MAGTNVKSVLMQRIESSVAEWWDRFWEYNSGQDRSRFVSTPNCVVENVGAADSSDPTQSDLALVLSNFVLSEQSVSKGADIIRTDSFLNDSNATVTESFTYSKTEVDTFSFKFAQGLKVGTKAEVKAGLSFLATAKVEVSGEISFNAEQSWSTQVSETFSDTVAIQVPPHSRVAATATLETAKGTYGFTADARVTNSKISVLMFLEKVGGGGESFSTPLDVMLPDDADMVVPLSGTLNGALGVTVTVTTEPITVDA